MTIYFKFGDRFLEECSLVKVSPKERWDQGTGVMEWPEYAMENANFVTGFLVWRIHPLPEYFVLLVRARHTRSISFDVEISKVLRTSVVPDEKELRGVAHMNHGGTVRYSRYLRATELTGDVYSLFARFKETSGIHVLATGQKIMDTELCVVEVDSIEGPGLDDRRRNRDHQSRASYDLKYDHDCAEYQTKYQRAIARLVVR